RGLHQDGVADTLDGLAGGRTPAERLAIMRDGRIGALGATGLVVILLLRYAGFTALLGADEWQAGGWMVLLCMPVIGRSAMVLGTVVAPYARPEGGLGAPFLAGVTWQDVAWAVVVAGGVLLGFLGLAGFCVGIALAVGVAWGIGIMARRLLGGITGDTLGAVNELAETLFLLAGPFLLTWQ
ncbi:MAG: adenosylcobinamide-GDP ribazoletransferase, partial [Nitrospirales bacterium]